MNRYPESSADGGPWRPAWADRDDIGEAVPHSFVLGRSKRSAAAVSGIVAYREGFVFDVIVRIRDADPSLSMLADDGIMAFAMEVDLGEGKRADSRLSAGPRLSEAGTLPVALVMLTGGGSGGAWDMRWLVTALPTSGPIQFAAHWPQVDVSFSTSIDGQPIIDAAQRSRGIWE